MKDGIVAFTLLAVLVAGVAGCKVQVNKSAGGGEDNVKIATPFGGIAVNQDQTSAAELGLPSYPGAVQDTGGEGSRSARVDLNFGSLKVRVRVGNYSSADSRDQVMAFYRKALTAYGNVIECAGGNPVGTPTVTREGLTCDSSGHKQSTGQANPEGTVLKAGSTRHQHLVILPDNTRTPTRFTLIALDLPHGFDSEQKGTN